MRFMLEILKTTWKMSNFIHCIFNGGGGGERCVSSPYFNNFLRVFRTFRFFHLFSLNFPELCELYWIFSCFHEFHIYVEFISLGDKTRWRMFYRRKLYITVYWASIKTFHKGRLLILNISISIKCCNWIQNSS